MTIKWETRTEALPADMPTDIIDGLNRLGIEGWEPFSLGEVFTSRGKDFARVWLKRVIPESGR